MRRWWDLLLILTALLLLYPATAGSVQVPEQVSTIQEAIHLAKPGDTIYIHGGVYEENLFINKRVNLVGVTNTSDTASPVPLAVQLDPDNPLRTISSMPLLSYAVIAPSTGNAITIGSDGVRITDIVLISRENCIDLGGHSEVSVEGCLLGQCGNGITGRGGDRLMITGNRFQTPEHTGIDLAYTADTVIQGNTFIGGQTGIRGDYIQRWSVKSNTFQDLKVVFTGNGMSDSVLQENLMDNCTMGYTILSSRNNNIQSDRFNNLTQYTLLLNSPTHFISIDTGNHATLITRDLLSAGTFQTPWFTLSGQNYAFSLVPPGSYSGFRSFGERLQISPELNRTQELDVVTVEAEIDMRMWEDIDPFTFAVYRVDRGEPLFTGVTYVSGYTVKTTTSLNASTDGTFALLAKKKIPFGLTIEGITSVLMVFAGLVALFLYRRKIKAKKGPSKSRAQEFRRT